MDHQLELGFRARHVALHDVGEVPWYVLEVGIAGEPAWVRPHYVLEAAQRGLDLVGTDSLLYRNFAGAEQKSLIGREIQVKPDLKLLRQPRDIGQVLDIVPHDGEVHADLQPPTLPLGDQVPEVADRGVKGASPAADMIVDAFVGAVHRDVEAPDAGGKHLFEHVRGQADSIRVQMHVLDAGSLRIGHNLQGVRADQRLAAGEVCLDYPQPHELIYDFLPFLGRQLVLGVLQPAGTADAPQVAILGQEQLGDERPDMNSW